MFPSKKKTPPQKALFENRALHVLFKFFMLFGFQHVELRSYKRDKRWAPIGLTKIEMFFFLKLEYQKTGVIFFLGLSLSKVSLREQSLFTSTILAKKVSYIEYSSLAFFYTTTL